ncbi:MAG: hypothetical protein O3C32_00580 [Bacteroidetes bacterium]|jgi:hypothetical protein|nr:hypothetical protein [Bacteroidota bacterium]
MKKWLKWIRFALGLASMGFLLGLAQTQPNRHKTTAVVEWSDNDTLELIDYQTVQALTAEFISNPNAWPRIDSIEDRLSRFPSIEGAQASVGINGMVRIRINQRDPLLRLIDSLGHQQYLDKQKQLFPALVGIPAQLPVVTGLPLLPKLPQDSTTMADLMALATALYADPFWWNFTDQVAITPQVGFVISPKLGNHQIILGSANELIGKLNKLRIFYRHGLQPSDWNTYSVIDARFKGQIVCQPLRVQPEKVDTLINPDSTHTLSNTL